jgi:hypothetical protein
MLTVLTVLDLRLPPRTIAWPSAAKINRLESPIHGKNQRRIAWNGWERWAELTRLSGEGRLIDLDPTIGGSLGEGEGKNQPSCRGIHR